MPSVFLSYDHEDVGIARPIAKALEKAGHKVWYDRHIHGGAQYSRRIEEELDSAEAVVVLWSARSLDSAWVRDEAAEGRDREKLVPVSLGGVTAPIGFRQFQTIPLGDWSGRGKVPHLADLLEAIDSQAAPTSASVASQPIHNASRPTNPVDRRRLTIAALAMLLAVAGVATWKLFGGTGMPVVQVTAASQTSASQSAASDLFVKLGSLAEVGQGKWKLVDAASAAVAPDLIFRTTDTGSPGRPQANLVLLDGKDGSLLWSREFSPSAGSEADLRQQLALTAGRVLGCALESRDDGGLRRDLLKLFLNTCAMLSETSMEEPGKVTGSLRSIIAAEPDFAPAWARLLSAKMGLVDLSRNRAGEEQKALRDLRADMEEARKAAPALPELILAEAKFLPATAYAQTLALLTKAAELAPDNAEIFAHQNTALQRVGQMSNAVAAARRAAELDPLSPAVTTQFIMTLAHNGQLDDAREELTRAERLWAGTGALNDALWAFHLRYGDPAIARRYARGQNHGHVRYLNARADPSPANVEKLAAQIRPFESRVVSGGMMGWVAQALGEFNRTGDVLSWIARTPTDAAAESSYIFFRPALAGLRQDPRFMRVADRIRLVDFWRSSGTWPDFCNEPDLPYDCKAEAAKYD